MNDYARATGRSVTSANKVDARASTVKRKLTDSELAKAAESRSFVHEHMPEALPFIRDLVSAGLLDGWRSVVQCELVDKT